MSVQLPALLLHLLMLLRSTVSIAARRLYEDSCSPQYLGADVLVS